VLLEPGEQDQALVEDVALERPQERKGRVVGPDGEPVTGVWALGLARLTSHRCMATLTGAKFTVADIDPTAPRQRWLFFLPKDRSLGFFLKELPDSSSGPLTVRLRPCGSASGRVVGQAGRPPAGTRVAVWCPYSFPVRVATDGEGHFRADGLVPGSPYWVEHPRPDAEAAKLVDHLFVESGKERDLGDLRLDR
jgi:hypothetical protein